MADYLSRDLNLSTITVLDKQQQQSFINWYHERLCHPGITRQYYTMKAVTTWPNLYQQLVSFINNCTTCQQMKNVKKSYGKLTGSLLNEIPFHTLAIDLYGPVSFPANETENEEVEEHRYILSMIDHCTRLVELAPLKTITAEEVIERLKDYWLCRYPRPHQILSDNGTQFTSKEFADLLTQYDVLHITTTTYNPTGNSVVERIHGTLGNALRTLNVHNWSDYLPDIVYSFRTSYQRSLGCSPAELVFSRHMVAYEPCSREKLLERANAKSKKNVQTSNQRLNTSRIDHRYQPGDLVYVKSIQPSKFEPRYHGPYPIESVNASNNTLKINYGSHIETINFRRVKPLPKESRMS
jgi:hypothetical protein